MDYLHFTALQAGSPGFESLTAHHFIKSIIYATFRPARDAKAGAQSLQGFPRSGNLLGKKVLSRYLRFALLMALPLIEAIPANTTTLVFKLEGNRILLAADNRQGTAASGARKQYTDNTCKIRSIGHTVLAISGKVAHYHCPTASAVVLDWDAFSDAQTAYNAVGDNPEKLADKWGIVSSDHIAAYAGRDPNEVFNELSGSPTGIMYGGILLGWIFGSPVIVLEYLAMEKGRIVANRYDKLPPSGTDHSTNKITQELIVGNSLRAKDAARR
jgi:hypothetical protein